MRRIVINLYDHTSDEEIADILQSIKDIGIDDATVEETTERKSKEFGVVDPFNGLTRS